MRNQQLLDVECQSPAACLGYFLSPDRRDCATEGRHSSSAAQAYRVVICIRRSCMQLKRQQNEVDAADPADVEALQVSSGFRTLTNSGRFMQGIVKRCAGCLSLNCLGSEGCIDGAAGGRGAAAAGCRQGGCAAVQRGDQGPQVRLSLLWTSPFLAGYLLRTCHEQLWDARCQQHRSGAVAT